MLKVKGCVSGQGGTGVDLEGGWHHQFNYVISLRELISMSFMMAPREYFAHRLIPLNAIRQTPAVRGGL